MTQPIPTLDDNSSTTPALAPEGDRAPRRFRLGSPRVGPRVGTSRAIALAALPTLAAVLIGTTIPLRAQSSGSAQSGGSTRNRSAAQSPAADTAHYRGKAGLVYGPRHAFIVRAPIGWTLDSRSGRRQGLQIVLYPNGESWSRSQSVIYCQVSPRGGSLPSIRELIAGEEQRFRNQSAEAMVAEAPAIRIDDSVTALVRTFSGGRNHAFEATAYIEARTVLVSLVLSCRSAEAFEQARAAFTAFVRSYRFLADDEENILRAVEAVEDDEAQ